MSVRMLTSARRLVSGHITELASMPEVVSARGLPSNFSMIFTYNGDATAGTGESPNLPGDEFWFDSSGLYRVGLNIGPTFINDMGSSCQVFASGMPRDYAHKVNTDAALVAFMSTKWISLGTITAGQKLVADGGIYSLMRLKFTGVAVSQVSAYSL